MASDILKKDFQLPKCDKKALGRFILSFLLPNIVFFCIAYYLNINRLMINIDYIIPCLLLLSHNCLIRTFGVVLFIILMLIETHLLVLKFFPFLNIFMVKDLLPFIFIGPTMYLTLTCILIICIISIVCTTWQLNKNQKNLLYPLVFSVFMLLLYSYMGLFYNLKYKEITIEEEYDIWKSIPFYIHSQTNAYREIFNTDFSIYSLSRGEIVPYTSFNIIGMDYIKKPYNKKILFIVAESFGVLNNKDAQKEIFQELYKESGRFEFIENGIISANASTLAAEFRELCRKSYEKGIDFRKTDNQKFSECVPNQLNLLGYKTISFHGASSYMYNRKTTYPKFGFQKSLFRENTLQKKQCYSFSGTCDSEFFSLVLDEFKSDEKKFIYWLTLTSHYPYSDKDIFNHRFHCEKYDFSSNTPLCRNLKLQTQFMDQLAELSKQPEMQGVEIFLVGDHPHQTIEPEDLLLSEKTTGKEQVSFIHFKIKE